MNENCKEGITKILVGNKLDLAANRQVKLEEGKELAEKHGMLFFETSAKSGTGIESAFMTAAQEIIKRHPNVAVEGANKKNMHLKNKEKDSKESGGCC